MAEQHTPGPWELRHFGQGTRVGITADGHGIATLDHTENQEANARLIAAAPALLAALERLSAGMWEGVRGEDYTNPLVYGEQVKQARKAIALARGEAPRA